MLLLFDIDLTLTDTSGAGMESLLDAGRDLFGPGFHHDGVEFAGRLDPLIISDMLRVSGVADSPEHHRRLREAYERHLRRRLGVTGRARALPGVLDLLGVLRADPRPTLGLLTGNFEPTGCMKLRAAGIDPAWFRVAVWGDESPHTPPRRDHLVPVGMDRYCRLHGQGIDGRHVTVIGDTPHDVECAKTHGCRSLAVGTGRSTLAELRAAGADLAVKDLSDTAGVARWLLGE